MRLISARGLFKTLTAFTAVIGSLFARGASFEVASPADIEKYAAATGGDEVRKIDNGDGTVDFIHIFTNAASTANFTVPAGNAIRYGSGRILVVGGGASGSGDCGGGGGAGGLIYQEGLTVASGTVTVGAGGAQSASGATGNNGADTVLTLGATTYTALGGGTGGRWGAYAGVDGGSGGGSSSGDSTKNTPGQGLQPSSASGGFGNSGGRGGPNDMGGGGGGAGSAGVNATGEVAGDGGAGLEYDISGEMAFYAAGGGGAATHGRVAGVGGSGIGGSGLNNKGNTPAGAGEAGTGSGGGGGGGGGSGTSIGGAGGSGVVIIRYTVKEPIDVPENVQNKVYSFKDTASGTIFNLPKAVKADILVVGGGGAGANPGNAATAAFLGGAGGGGAGGMIEASGVYLEAGKYDIVVGSGGISPLTQGKGGDGESSRVLLSGAAKYEAIGGGGGGIVGAGNSGGSGGGGSRTGNGGLGIDGQGFAGGKGSHLQAGGGGGGAGSVGGDTIANNAAGVGGLGRVSFITGSEVYYAAGGGGGTYANLTSASSCAFGGSGIGGNGAYGTSAEKVSATAGRKNTGSGGGGGCYGQPGGNGGSGIVIIRIIDVMPDRPNDNYAFDYDGEKHVLYKGGSGVTITKDGVEVSEIAVKNAGTYNYEVTLKEGYKWGDLTDNSPINVTVTVGAPQVTVESLSIEQWQAGQAPKKPVVVTSPFQVSESDYIVKYAAKGTSNWSEAAPTVAGEYDVTIEFMETDNFTVAGTIPVTSVTLWAWDDSDKYLDSLGYHAKITINATNETPLVNFPMLIKIREGMPKGFEYKYANPDGSDIRFIDSEGNLLAHEFDTWDTTGESIIWVKVPQYFKGASITMCWGELVDKKAPAALDPKEVWTAYLGVWHMENAKNSLTGTFGTIGTNNQGKKAGVIGNSLGKTSAEASDAILTADTASNQKLNELNGTGDPIGTYHSRTFTASFWVSLNGNSNANAMFFSRKSRVPNNDESDNQWGFALRTANNEGQLRFFLKDESTRWDANLSSQMGTGNKWYRMDVIFDDAYDLGDGDTGYSAVWLNGALAVKRTVGSTFASCTEKFRIGRAGAGYGINGYMDEVRIMPGTAPQAWIEADYKQVTQNDTFYTYSPTKVTPGAYFKNRWLRDPSVTKVSWIMGEEPAEADAGEAVYGDSYYTFSSVTSAITNAVPTEFGGYVFVAQVDSLTPVENGAFGYEPLRGAEVDVVITNESPDSNLGGVGGDATLAGRVLLANDWGAGDGAIRGQDYSNTNSANSTFWVHSAPIMVANTPFLNKTSQSELFASGGVQDLCGSATIWHLDNIHIGNLFTGNESSGFIAEYNYLPWSTEALPNGEQSESSHLVMRNVADAAIYSPCYTNGIGTIYFDAVNALAGVDGTEYKIVVEICTNTTNGVNVPSDENIGVSRATSFVPQVDEEGHPVLNEDGIQLTDEIPGYTNRYQFADWKPVKIFALKRDGTPNFVAPVEAEELALDIANGGSVRNFYRVYAKLNYNGPIRFRIRRASVADGAGEDGAFILIDNVIASYPSMRMDLESYGTFDPGKLGKNTLGFEGAFDIPFPSVKDDIIGRAKPVYTVSAADPDADTGKFVVASKMFYRWRYLEQQVSEWHGVTLDHKNGFKAVESMKLEKDKPGDVEYYFVSWLNAPFYDYVDYSGADLKLGGFYSENTAQVTNRFDSATKLESCGKDWFIRLREGRSNFERVNLVITEKIEDDYTDTVYKTNSIPMELVGEGMWRGLYQTLDKNDNGIEYRLEFMNEQVSGATERNLTTNYFKIAENWTKLPVTDKLTETATPEYSTLPVDGVTGYLLFQIDEETKAMTIVRADYQNFNTWSDANNKNGAEIFVGNSTEDEGKTGASPKSIETRVSATNWVDMVKTSNSWKESFDTTTTMSANDNVEFSNGLSPNGWNINNGMFILSNYKDDTAKTQKNKAKDRALQMLGNGLGNMEFVDSSDSPRGIETISFNARLGQKLVFDEVAYYNGGAINSMTNYTVVVAGAFDTMSNRTFRGNASLSIFAHYRPRVGAYEFRVEQILADGKTNGSGDYQAARQGQQIAIYRWRYKGGKYVATRLGYYSNKPDGTFKVDWPLSDGESGYQALYFSVSNCTEGVCLAAGFKNDSTGIKRAWNLATDVEGKSFNNLVYIDNHADRISGGSYGFLTANSEGAFARPIFLNEPVSVMGKIHDDYVKPSPSIKLGSMNRYSNTAVNFKGTPVKAWESMENDEWIYWPERLGYDAQKEYFKAFVPTQKVEIYTAPAGKSSPWTLLTERTIDTFGKSGKQTPYKIDVYSLDDCSVKIAAGGETDSEIRTDIVIDDVEISQFRGGEWDDAQNSMGVGNWKPDTYQNGYTNFVFTTAWVRDGAIMLSAKRTKPNDSPSSIRGPLYDGRYTSNYSTLRGVGLGMFSFKYKNAHPNVNLLLQIATNNVSESTMSGIDTDIGRWTTVTNFSFKTLSDDERKQGIMNCYLGLHGVKGVMRLVMDPALVNTSQSLTDPADFPEIYITDVYTRDEPMLDYRAWWGWNLRTLGEPEDLEKRMYLYDRTTGLPNGMSLALNNSVTDDVFVMQNEEYKQYQPFLQTPTFATNVVGEISFKARKYDVDNPQPAQVTVYGSYTGSLNSDWVEIGRFIVSNSTYTTYTKKTEPGKEYKAFRLAVTGVKGVVSANPPNRAPEGYEEPVRVLIDEVLVSEAIRARFEFRRVGAFRTGLDTMTVIPNVPSMEQQPMAGESWGVQCEVYPSQLADEIDLTRKPIVKLHWFEGEIPWGYNNWRSNNLAKSAYLAEATDTNGFYRSSYRLAQDAVIETISKKSTTVQYELEVIYYTKGSQTPQTNFLSESRSWVTPEWYKGVDKNAGKDSFSAYSILDSVAPGWAWINEVNIFGTESGSVDNTDSDYQYVEIAVPAEADIGGWSVKMVEATDDSHVVTNTVAVFGDVIPSTKPNLIGMASNMVYRVIANQKSASSGRLKYDDGTLDGVWKIQNAGWAMAKSGNLYHTYPIGVQLVRASGIVEHEILFVGKSLFTPGTPLYEEKNPSNNVQILNRLMPGSRFIYIGNDDQGEGKSLSVMTSRGEDISNWTNLVQCTPGRINIGQQIDPDHPTPNGTSILLYANLDTVFGHIRQTIGDAVNTNGNVILVIPKGSERGTNITYTVDRWYDLAKVTTNGVAASATPAGPRTFTTTVGVGASNNVTVVASAKLSDKLVEEYGLGPDNKYRDAVVDWLEKGESLKFGEWANPDSDDIKLAEYQSLSGNIVTNLTLTQMYWLDIDPTAGDFVFRGGMVGPPQPITRSVSIDGVDYLADAPNFKMDVKLYITNKTENAESMYYNMAWAPYVLRGRGKGENSLNYSYSSARWTNVTFKITGFLNNGFNKLGNKDNWIPQRWFVFTEDSFDEDFVTSVEIKDPFSKDTPGYSNGWYDWHLTHPNDALFFSWSLDTRLEQFPVEPLKKENFYENEP